MTSVGALFRFWLTLERPVSRAAYLRHGVALALVKYAVDATLVFVATDQLWSPASYLMSAPAMLSARFGGAPGWLVPALAAWTLPFLWIGVGMTLRRALDAGTSAWVALLFFVPLVSYLTIAALCVAPTSSRPPARRDRLRPGEGRRLPSAMSAMAVGTALGLGMLLFGVQVLNTYGLALFMGTPFVVGAVTAFLFCQTHPAELGEALEVVAMTSLFIAGAAFALGTEGVVCLLMLLPLGLVIALMGGLVGHWIADYQPRSIRGAGMVAVLLPFTAAVEDARPFEPALREVVTAVEIAAPPEVVWQHVIAFPPLAPPDELLFRLGVAYPTHAELHGAGVGAVRHCVFSTGTFVEPITVWEPGRRLSFDVVASPPPLRELTPYRVAPPHLDGYLAPRRGEFRLVPLPDGRTRLEGSTWYEQRLRPELYWALFSDRIIGAIHGRVLDHVKTLSEAAPSHSPEAES